MSNLSLNEQEQFRRDSLKKLRDLGIEPYPAALYPVNASTQKIKDEYDAEKGNFQDVVIAGRLMSRRIMGAASFGEIQDESGRIQVYINRDEICPGEDKTFDTDDISDVKEFLEYGIVHRLVFTWADFISVDVDLDTAALVLDLSK